jgi:hypothetical protein
MNFKITDGFESAEFESAKNFSYADVKRSDKGTEHTIDSQAVHLVISDEVYWAADDLREFVTFLSIIADRIDLRSAEDEQEDYNEDDWAEADAYADEQIDEWGVFPEEDYR